MLKFRIRRKDESAHTCATLKRLEIIWQQERAKLADEANLINQNFMLVNDAPVDKPYLITKTKDAAMDVWSLYEDVKPIGFQEFF